MIDKKKQGKRNLEKGRRFENLVRKDLESKGWIVSRWQNNVDIKWIKLEDEKTFKQRENLLNKCYREVKINDAPTLCLSKLIPAKQGKFRKTSTGFPDFIAYKIQRIYISLPKNVTQKEAIRVMNIFEEAMKNNKKVIVTDPDVEITPENIIIGIECKTNGYLTREEKEKCEWLLENKIFSKILIASKGKKGEILYKNFNYLYKI